jgi:hypothetical protein
MRHIAIPDASFFLPGMRRLQAMATCLFALTGGCMISSNGHASTVDFDALADTSSAFYEHLEVQGYTFTNSTGSSDALGTWPVHHSYQADPDFSAIFVNKAYSTTTARRIDGKPFNFHRIDLTDLLNEGLPLTMAFTFRFLDGHSEEEQVTLLPQVGLKAFEAERSGLLSVSWRTVAGANGWSQFDNFSASASDNGE